MPNKKPMPVNKGKPQKKQLLKKDDSMMLYLYLGLCLVLTAIVFSNSLNGKFLTWDDNLLVPENKDIRSLSLVNLKKIFTSYYIGMYQPLTTLCYAVIYHFFKLDVMPYHLFNLLLHLANTALVFYLIYIMTDRKEAALIVALFFGIHPMHVESVAWIAELKDVLYGFFFIASLIFYIKYINEIKSLKAISKKNQYYFFSIILFIFSLFSKSAAVTLPVLFLAFDYYYDRINFRSLKKFGSLIIEKIPFFMLSITFGIIALKTQTEEKAIVDVTPLFSILDRFFLVSYSTSYYIIRLFLPIKLSTLHYYPINSGNTFPPEFYLAPVFLILIIVGVLLSKKYKKLFIFGLMFYLITIALVLQVIPVGQALVAERYTYIPYIGLLFIFGKLFVDVADNKVKNSSAIKPYFTGIIVILAIIFSYITYQRNFIWKDTVTLFTDVINKDPGIFYSYTVRGGALINDKKYREGIEDYEKSIKLQPNYYDPYFNIGKGYYYLGDLNRAISYYNKAIELKPDFAQAYSNRAAAYFGLGNLQATILDCNKAISLKPEYADAYVNRGNAKGMLKDYAGSIADFDKGIQFDPTLKEAYMNRGLSKVLMGKNAEGCEDFRTALSLGDSLAISLINKYCK
jgi:tetratricopeptide (TPR) repeat protein